MEQIVKKQSLGFNPFLNSGFDSNPVNNVKVHSEEPYPLLNKNDPNKSGSKFKKLPYPLKRVRETENKEVLVMGHDSSFDNLIKK